MITRVEGILVGHVTDEDAATGCTVVLCPPGTVGSVSVMGGAPGTRETDALRPGTLVDEVHAVVLSGGSAYGLSAADGVMRWLEERGIGFDAGGVRVPIVPAAILFDLGVGDPSRRPGPDDGYAACQVASEAVEEGSVGAGTGATVAKLAGPGRAVKGGIGTTAVEEDDLVVGALAAVNALGEIVDDAGEVIAGPRDEGEPEAFQPTLDPGMNTTLVVVATNATLSKDRAHLVARAGHEGLTRAVRPVHTIWDGDAVFALATGRVEAPQAVLERLAADAVAESVRRAVRLARPLAGVPSAGGSGE
jgi:L-aminopeptidase/D-esterase-like protein